MTQTQTVKTFYTDTQKRGRVGGTIRDYMGFFDDGNGGGVEVRKAQYGTMVNNYYDVVTDFYEHGWGQSFHFAPRAKGESFDASLARAEHYLALRLGLKPGMKVLDVGCGVGGPMRSIARFTGASIEGVNNNDYQLEKVASHNEKAGLGDRCSGFKGDFMNLGVPDRFYDAAYEIEATCHAPDKAAAFTEIRRVLKPGALFAGYEWCMTNKFDPNDVRHQEIKSEIETGDGLPDIASIPETIQALEKAGFEVIQSFDAAGQSDPETPWYLPLLGESSSLLGIRRGRLGRRIARRTIGGLEALGIAPKGSKEVSLMLGRAAEALIAGGETGIFTPSYFFIARRRA
ncbi:MAG: methyltransferase domain-containing protein [Myxococcales bacterium]|nr:MAG: methyltransferase domain-containing protein [Myxococcales bacterium]